MGSFATLHVESLKHLLEACHNCPKGSLAQVSIGNMVSERPEKGTVHPFSFLCCQTIITTEGAIFWHSEDITLEAIASRTQSYHQPVQIRQNPTMTDEECNEFVDMIVKCEDDSAKTVANEDDAPCKVVLEKDPLLLDESCGVQADRVGCRSEGKVQGCDIKAVKKKLRKSFVGILGQQDLLGMNISEQSNYPGCTIGKKYPETFICEFCGKIFKGKERAYQFYYHRNCEHTHETTFKCDVCSKEFWGDRELLAHRTQHKDQGHVCDICGQRFTANKNLKVHLLIHAPTREHICSYCDKSFRRKDHLTVHERIHTGIRPYQCQWCDSGYPQKHQLKLHIRKCPILRQTEVKLYAT